MSCNHMNDKNILYVLNTYILYLISNAFQLHSAITVLHREKCHKVSGILFINTNYLIQINEIFYTVNKITMNQSTFTV